MELLNEIINTEGITSIKVYPKRVNINYTWKEQFKLWFLIFVHEGFYNYNGTHLENFVPAPDENIYVEGHWVFFKPHIVVDLNNRTDRRKYFNTMEELNEFISQFLNKNIKFFYF